MLYRALSVVLWYFHSYLEDKKIAKYEHGRIEIGVHDDSGDIFCPATASSGTSVLLLFFIIISNTVGPFSMKKVFLVFTAALYTFHLVHS